MQAYLSTQALRLLEDGLKALSQQKIKDADRAGKALFVITAVLDNVSALNRPEGQGRVASDQDANWLQFRQQAFAQIQQGRDVYNMFDQVLNTC